MSDKQQVAILGASDKPERYSYKAFSMLREYGHQPLPVHPRLKEIEGLEVFANLGQLPQAVDTLTLYVGPQHIAAEIPAILALAPGRVIMNPGTESGELKEALDKHGIPWLEACTLVLLRSGQF